MGLAERENKRKSILEDLKEFIAEIYIKEQNIYEANRAKNNELKRVIEKQSSLLNHLSYGEIIKKLHREKPVIVYGNPWYKNLPGVISVNSEENLINIPSIILNKYIFPEKNFYESISNLLNNCVKSNHYKNVAKRSNISNEESIVNLSRYIQENY